MSSLEERFWTKVLCDLASGCWLWTGALNSKGYAVMHVGPRRGQSGLASHVSWDLHFGPTRNGRWVLHTCDNGACVRPEHLFLGNNQANMDDMWAKGRGVLPRRQPTSAERARGERDGSAKLTAHEVAKMRERYASGNVSQMRLAADYGIAQTQVSRILRRVWWKHVP